MVKSVDYAFIDATFYDAEEVGYRNFSEIPHPFVVESMKVLDVLEESQRAKVNFIHMNHTNPLLERESLQSKEVLDQGFNIARFMDIFML